MSPLLECDINVALHLYSRPNDHFILSLVVTLPTIKNASVCGGASGGEGGIRIIPLGEIREPLRVISSPYGDMRSNEKRLHKGDV